ETVAGGAAEAGRGGAQEARGPAACPAVVGPTGAHAIAVRRRRGRLSALHWTTNELKSFVSGISGAFQIIVFIFLTASLFAAVRKSACGTKGHAGASPCLSAFGGWC